MKADPKTTKPIGRGKSKTQKAPPTHKAAAPKPHEKKTERKRTEEALQQAEIRYRALVEQTPAVIYTVDSRQPDFFVYISQQIEALSGYSPQAWIADTQLWNNLIHTEDRERVLAEEIRTNKTGEPFNIEYRLVHRDGHLVWVHEEARLLHDASGQPTDWQGFMLDITERKQAEETLSVSEVRYRRLFESAKDGILIIDAENGAVVDVNPFMLEMLGYSHEAFIGMRLWELGFFKNIIANQDNFTELQQKEYIRYENLPLEGSDGQRHDVEFVSNVYLVNDRKVIQCNIRDITHRKRAEQEIARQLERMRALREVDLAIMGTTSVNLSLRTILDQALIQLRVDAADILVLNPHTQTLGYIAGRGFRSKNIEQSSIRIGQGIAGRAALEQQTVHIPNLASVGDDFVRTSLVADEGFVEYYGVPLIAKGNLIGLLEIFQRQPLGIDSNGLDFMNALAGQASIAIDNNRLFSGLHRANQDLLLAYDTTIEGWSHALDLRDKETEGHTLRVTDLTIKLGRAAGMSEEELLHVRRGALLHDIGKMGVPDHILLKPDKLTDEEWIEMRKHPVFAYELLSPIAYLRPALDIPYCHHEKWDGSGYPRGLKGDQIPLAARLFAIVDVWDALRSDRPYRQGWPKEKVIKHIRSLSGIHFDPKAVDLFLNMLVELSKDQAE